MSALLGTSCGSSRKVSEVSSFRVQDSRDSVRVEQVMVAVHDTIMETTTIVVRENELGDTIRMMTVTDRTRSRGRDNIATYRTKVEVRTDTVYVERRDSIKIRSRPSIRGGQGGGTALHRTLKWIFWIIVAIGALIIIIKVTSFINPFKV